LQPWFFSSSRIIAGVSRELLAELLFAYAKTYYWKALHGKFRWYNFFRPQIGSTVTILSFQSSVAYGYVGNAAAVFCLRRAGFEVWPVDTVIFSNHPGHGGFRGHVRDAARITEIVDGLDDLDVLKECRAVISGYMGSKQTAQAVLRAVGRVKALSPDALYCCDPVMGDVESGLYVAAGLSGFFRTEAVAAADILMPNHFELEVLAEHSVQTAADVLAATDLLLSRGARVVVVTSLLTSNMDPDTIANLAATRDGAWLVTTPRLPLTAKGAGDALAALFLGFYLEHRSAGDALSRAVSSIFAVVKASVHASELRLIEAQDAIAEPPRRFLARKVR
jgi:pyridoxine kinase